MDSSLSALLRNRQFVLLWLNQFLSQISYNLLNFSLVIIVYRLTGSTLAVSVLLIFFWLPALFFSLPAGLVSDLFDKKKVLFFSDIFWAVAVLLIFLNSDHLWRVLLLVFLAKFFDAFFFPAETASVPQIVDRERLTKANSLFSFTAYSSLLVGFSLAGPIMRFGSPQAPLLVASALTALGALSIACLSPLKSKNKHKLTFAKSALNIVFSHLVEGLRFLKSKPLVLGALTVSILGQVFATLLSNLMPEYAELSLGISAEDTSFILVLPLAIGILCGLFFLNKFLRDRLKRSALRLGLSLVGVALLGLSFAPLFRKLFFAHLSSSPLPFERALGVSALAGILFFIIGFGASLVLIPSLTFSQQNTPAHLRGRSFGFYGALTAFFVISVVVPLGGSVEFIGVPAVLVVLGVFVLLVFWGVGRFLSPKWH